MNDTFLILIAGVLAVVCVITTLLLFSYRRKYLVLKKRYVFLSNEFDTLSASYYIKGEGARDKEDTENS